MGQALSAMLACDVPIVARIAGACMGGGGDRELLRHPHCRCQCTLWRTHRQAGLSMAPREGQLVAGAVGETIARQMLLEAATFSAADLLAQGFLSRVVAPRHCRPRRWQCAAHCRLAPGAARLNKQTLRALKTPPAQSGQAQTAIESIANGATDPMPMPTAPSTAKGISAFLAKASPGFDLLE